MKKISLFLFVLLALAACAPAPAQTSEVSKTSEVSPSSTPTPPATPTRIATATATPSALESGQGQALLGLGYPEKQLQEFVSFTRDTFSFTNDKGEIDPVAYDGIIGTKADGTKDILAFKFSGIPDLVKISGTELANYAKEARKSPISGSSFEKHYVGDQRELIIDINSVSTGVIVQFEKDVGGKKIIFKTGLMATRTDQGIPVPFLEILQMVDASNPGVDLLENSFLWASGLSPSLSTQVHSDEEWAVFIPGGKHLAVGVKYKISSNARIKGSIFFRDNFADENYLKALQLFLDSHGSKQTGDLMITLSSGIKFTE